MINNYTPFSFYVIHLITSFFPNSIVAGRILSLVSIVFISLMSYGVARQLGAEKIYSFFSALWFSATMFRGYTNYSGMNDPHLFGLALMTLGFYLFMRWRNTRLLYACFVVFVVGGLAKNSLFALPLAAICILFIERNDRRYRVLAFSLACIALSTLFLYELYGNLFFSQMFIPRTVEFYRIIGSLQRIQWLAIPLLFWAVSFRSFKRRQVKYVTAAMVVSGWLFWWMTGVVKGVGTNAIFELAFSTSVALACAASAAFATRLQVLGRTFTLGPIVFSLIILRLLASFDMAPYALLLDPSYRAEIERRANRVIEDVAFVRGSSKNVACSVMTVCYLAGKPYDLTAPRIVQRSEDKWSDKP